MHKILLASTALTLTGSLSSRVIDNFYSLQEHKKLVGISEVDAKVKYTQLARSLKTYGITFFLVKVCYFCGCHGYLFYGCIFHW